MIMQTILEDQCEEFRTKVDTGSHRVVLCFYVPHTVMILTMRMIRSGLRHQV